MIFSNYKWYTTSKFFNGLWLSALLIKNIEQLSDKKISKKDIRSRTNKIRRIVLSNSASIKDGNFEAISVLDLQLLFDNYLSLFLPIMHKMMDMKNFSLKLSNRMTRSGGKTTRTQQMKNNIRIGDPKYKITLSAILLFQSFNVKKDIIISGINCKDRLDALQRIFEHELIHLLEMLIWNKTSCRKARFKKLANNIFGHSDVTHGLINPNDAARETFGIEVGMMVEFVFEGKKFKGIVNRITKRATILVKASTGRLYKDGNRYNKFYIPIQLLTPVST